MLKTTQEAIQSLCCATSIGRCSGDRCMGWRWTSEASLATHTKKHFSSIPIRGPATRFLSSGEIDDKDVTRFMNEMDAWASAAKCADVGVPRGNGWEPDGNPHVDGENINYVIQFWKRNTDPDRLGYCGVAGASEHR